MFLLKIPDELADRLSDVVSSVNRDGKLQTSRADVIAAALDATLKNGGVTALRLAFLHARVAADSRRHERRRLAAAKAGRTVRNGRGGAS